MKIAGDKVNFLNIELNQGKYVYTYGFANKLFFIFKIYYKFTFVLDLPHYWFTELEKLLIENGFTFDVTPKNKELKLDRIGTYRYDYFTLEDHDKYGKNVNQWQHLTDEAVKEQIKLCNEYEKLHGMPDLSWLH